MGKAGRDRHSNPRKRRKRRKRQKRQKRREKAGPDGGRHEQPDASGTSRLVIFFVLVFVVLTGHRLWSLWRQLEHQRAHENLGLSNSHGPISDHPGQLEGK